MTMQNNIPRWLVIAMLALALAGFVDATFLSVEFLTGSVPPCSIVNGCETVTFSPYATIGGIPIAALGAAYYLFVLLMTIAYLDSKKIILLKIVALATPFPFLFSLYLFYLQAFVLDAYCIYCLFSAATSTLLFVLGILVFRNSPLRKGGCG